MHLSAANAVEGGFGFNEVSHFLIGVIVDWIFLSKNSWYVASERTILHELLVVLKVHFICGDKEQLRFRLGFVLCGAGCTLQKGQLKMLPSTSFRQHFQQICLWLQGGIIQISLSSQHNRQGVNIANYNNRSQWYNYKYITKQKIQRGSTDTCTHQYTLWLKNSIWH